MTEYVLGLDGGGTKTDVSAVDLEGTELFSFESGAINYNSESADCIRYNISDILEQVSLKSEGLDGCVSICIGAAGISNPEAKTVLKSAVRGCGYTGELIIKGDHEAALFGALRKNCGIIIISGTGSICYGRNEQGEEHRTGGFGHIIDDEASGYAIGRAILSAIVRAYDGRGSKTLLTQMVFERLGVSSVADIIKFVYGKNTGKRDIAALAPILSLACAARDTAALKIVDECIMKLVELVIPVADKLGLKNGEIAAAGSILLKDEYIRNGFVRSLKVIYPTMECIAPRSGAAYGAALIALECL